MKSFTILAILRRIVQHVSKAHFRVIAPGQHSSFRDVTAKASRWQHCVEFDRPKLEHQTSRSSDERLIVWPTAYYSSTHERIRLQDPNSNMYEVYYERPKDCLFELYTCIAQSYSKIQYYLQNLGNC